MSFTVQEILDNPELAQTLRDEHQQGTDKKAAAEDRYYEEFGEELDKHPLRRVPCEDQPTHQIQGTFTEEK